ncbi:hypothetical protein BJP25_08865 [Actinokineospora bangkokensis]|uniref:Uncharacterized protein n=1 Tax=Actinokineospora bangkokensis TaxID=1193682 RepID=A0A1Q9LSN3_9PSEU|nr:hypothetical protein BJP25_08865 [Actinokineospora bangkokensis]
MLLAAAFAGQGAVLAVGAVLAAVVVAVLVGVASIAPGESWVRGRVLWALLVAVLGFTLWGFGWAISDEAGLGISGDTGAWLVSGVVPFAVVAGMLLRSRALAIGFAVVFVATGGILLHALARTMPPEVDQRLAVASAQRLDFAVTDVPGYRSGFDSRVQQLMPVDTDPNPPDPFIVLYDSDNPGSADCDYDPVTAGGFYSQSCEVERPGLFYLRGWGTHAYVLRVPGKQFTLTAATTHDRAFLRGAILTARESSAPGTYTATVPGYSGAATPGHNVFTPDDPSTLPGARNITVSVRDAHTCTCEFESRDLRYRRFPDHQEYTKPAGAREILVWGGPAVDRDLLRTAARNAHPATDDELLDLLPPLPPAHGHSPMIPVRKLATALFG